MQSDIIIKYCLNALVISPIPKQNAQCVVKLWKNNRKLHKIQSNNYISIYGLKKNK